ncbi:MULTISPECIES: STAS domain-containing protein [unclassified Nocardioides]|uniref:STAS domain-containing protein n=1 Tax=unclassified Nocardioides TaxID=2615069 RepID=UPI0036212A9D
MDATFDFSYNPPVAVLSIAGELDTDNRDQLAWRLVELDALGTTIVRLDLGRVSYIDVGSLRLIDDARRRLLGRGAALELGSVTPYFAVVCGLAGYVALAAQAERLGGEPSS